MIAADKTTTKETLPELLVFSDDWGRHPSSCQHLIKSLMPRYQVHWVNTIGTRLPALNWYTIRRGAGKLRNWVATRRRSSADDSNPHVLNPMMWPSFRSSTGRWLNRGLLCGELERVLEGRGPVIGLTTIPIVADLVGKLPVNRWIYYCVDDLSEWPGLDKQSLQQMELDLLTKVDDVIAVSQTLADRLRRLGRSSTLLTHGVELEHWTKAESNGEEAAELDGLPRPLFVFWGLVDRRLDSRWITRLSQRLAQGTIVLVGPEDMPDESLNSLPNLRRVPALPYARLPAIARSASVLIMPYADLPATRSMQPLKLKEYLATGKPVVLSDLPAVQEWRDAADVARSADEFVDLALLRVGSDIPKRQQQARVRLNHEGWSAKAQVLEQILLSGTSPTRVTVREAAAQTPSPRRRVLF